MIMLHDNEKNLNKLTIKNTETKNKDINELMEELDATDMPNKVEYNSLEVTVSSKTLF